MRVQYKINNYTLGAKLKITPVHKIVQQYRTDQRHTIVIYQDLTRGELELINKVFARKGLILD